jgi:hypothetical protein
MIDATTNTTRAVVSNIRDSLPAFFSTMLIIRLLAGFYQGIAVKGSVIKALTWLLICVRMRSGVPATRELTVIIFLTAMLGLRVVGISPGDLLKEVDV